MSSYGKPSNVDGRQVHQYSQTPGERPKVIAMGEVAVNAADGTLHVGRDNGTSSMVPGADGITRVVRLNQSAYDALVSATATISTVLYVVTPDPE